jgi:hypothetical protein
MGTSILFGTRSAAFHRTEVKPFFNRISVLYNGLALFMNTEHDVQVVDNSEEGEEGGEEECEEGCCHNGLIAS